MGFSRLLRLALADALEGTEVDEHVDQGVEVGDGPTVAQFGALNAQFDQDRFWRKLRNCGILEGQSNEEEAWWKS